mmetsp:Transcript_29364/g.94194  ORF Transcript_29364/g.94194 Transcript_29364/m.94194 type:complete len:359 (+) Transcript_29364:373-1449(+)
MHPAGCDGPGCDLPGRVRYGQDRRVRALHAAPIRARRRRGERGRALPHARAGVPDQPRVRALQQVPGREDRRVLRRRAGEDEHPDAEGRAAAHRRGHARPHQEPRAGKAPKARDPQVLRHGRVRPPSREARHARPGAGDLPRDAAGEAGHDVQRHHVRGDPPGLPPLLPEPVRDLHRRRHEADAARPAPVLRAPRREREEPQAHGPARHARVQPGGHLRVQGEPRDGAGPPAERGQLPVHLHHRQHAADGAHQEVQGVQGVQAPLARVHGPLRPRHRHRARQHRRQLRLPGRLGPVPASRGPRRPLRHQGPRHQLRHHRRGQHRARRRAEPLRGRGPGAPGADRARLVHERVGLSAKA